MDVELCAPCGCDRHIMHEHCCDRCPCVQAALDEVHAVVDLFSHMPDSTGVGDHRLTLGSLRVIVDALSRTNTKDDE